MDKRSRKEISGQYDRLCEKHGFSMRALHLGGARYDKIHQEIKFQYVLDQLCESDSLLDVGCGLGHLADYCRTRGWNGNYSGVDISKNMVAATRERLATEDVHVIDLLEASYDRRHQVVACVSTLQEKPAYENPAEYLEGMIKIMFEICTKCVIFDVFSNRFSDYEHPDNLYVDPKELLDMLHCMTNRLNLFNDYNPYQLMVVLYKESLGGWRSETS